MTSCVAVSFLLVVATIAEATAGDALRTPLISKVWTKAQAVLPEPTQRKLFSQLVPLDKTLLEASKRPKDDLAEVSKIQKKAQEELRNVLVAYGLEVYDENGPIRVFDDMRNPMKLGDPVLESLWSKARKNAAFSDNDLVHLWEELVDHKTRLNGFDSIEKNVSQNPVKQKERRIKQENNFKMLQDNLSRIRNKVESKDMASSVDDPELPEFSDANIKELWKNAKHGPFSLAEKEKIKEELMHFEMRLQRYRELVEHAKDVHHEDHQSKVSQLIMDTRTQLRSMYAKLSNKLRMAKDEL